MHVTIILNSSDSNLSSVTPSLTSHIVLLVLLFLHIPIVLVLLLVVWKKMLWAYCCPWSLALSPNLSQLQFCNTFNPFIHLMMNMKVTSWFVSYARSPLRTRLSHLQVHHLAKHQHCISVMKGKSSSNQSHSTKYLTTKSDVKGAVPKIIPPWACGMQ